MTKRFLGWLAASAVIMFVLPYFAVTFIKGDEGMAVCFLLFYGINPVFSLFIGFSSGRDWKRHWSLPVLSALLFLAGIWLFFGMGEPAFILYAVIYLALGTAAMAVSGSMAAKASKRRESSMNPV